MRSGHPPPARSTNQTKEQFLRHLAHVATCCEQQENLDAQNSWGHPVPALMPHVLVPLEKSASRLSRLSYKICLHNVQLHPTHAIPHPQHLDHRDKRHLKRLPTECLFLRCAVLGKTDRKKLLHMQCMFLSHFKQVLTPIIQSAFFTSGQTIADTLSQLPQIHISKSFIMLVPFLLQKWHHVWCCLHKAMTPENFLRLCRHRSGAKGLELSLAHIETLWDWGLNVWQHKIQLVQPSGDMGNRLNLYRNRLDMY